MIDEIEVRLALLISFVSMVEKSTTLVNGVPTVDSAKLVEQLKREILSTEVEKEDYINSMLLEDGEPPF